MALKDYHNKCPLPDFWSSWGHETKSTIDKVNNMHRSIEIVQADTQHLRCLPEIAKQLEHMNENLLAPATGRKQVPIQTHLMMMLILSLMVVLMLVERFGVTVRATDKGFEVDNSKQSKIGSASVGN